MISYRPKAPLDVFVERIWWNDRARSSAHREHVLPSGKAQLVIALHDERLSWSTDLRGDSHAWTAGIVHGPQSSYYLTGPKPRGAVMGVSFRPGAAGPVVLGVPPSALTDGHVSLGDLWGSRGTVLRERLADAATPQAAFTILEEALTARLRRPPPVHPAVAHALRASLLEAPRPRVADIRRETGFSAKHFIALFRAAVGLTPKQYLRIRRFGTVLEHLAAERPGTLCDLAAAAGYADQSHLNREFRELAGIAPTEYRPPARTSEYHHIVAGRDLRAYPR